MNTMFDNNDDYLDYLLEMIIIKSEKNLNSNQKMFLKYTSDGNKILMDYYRKLEYKSLFISDDNLFYFILSSTKKDKGSLKCDGCMIYINEKPYNYFIGNIVEVVNNKNSIITYNFINKEKNILDLCSNLEYELDNFAEYIITSIKEE